MMTQKEFLSHGKSDRDGIVQYEQYRTRYMLNGLVTELSRVLTSDMTKAIIGKAVAGATRAVLEKK